DQAIFKSRQLLFGNSRSLHQFGTAHAARLTRVVKAGLLPPCFCFGRHSTIVTDSVSKFQARVFDRDFAGDCGLAMTRWVATHGRKTAPWPSMTTLAR